MNQIGYTDCYVSEVTLAELRYGAYKSDRPKENLELIERFSEKINIVPFAETIDFYAKEKNRLNRQGTPFLYPDRSHACSGFFTVLND